MDIIPCDNHTCTARFDKANDEYHTCALCLQPAYCSDECRLMDWRAHDCPNVYKTEDIKQGFAVPYYYEDMLTAEELEEVPVGDPIFQSHQVMHCNTNRTVSEYMIPSLVEKNAISQDYEGPVARGKNPEDIKSIGKYMLRIQVGEQSEAKTYDIYGNIPKDMIFKDNSQNETARAISGGGATTGEKLKNIFKGGLRRALHSQETSYIFWPGAKEFIEKDIKLPSLSESLIISLWVLKPDGNWEEVSNVSTGIRLDRPGGKDVSSVSRRVRQMFRTQLNLKFKSVSNISLDDLVVKRHGDGEGNSVVLTFQITPKSDRARLVDVEYVTDALAFAKFTSNKTLSAKEKELMKAAGVDSEKMIESRFACDVRNFEEVVGLAMALDTFIASPPSNGGSRKMADLRDLEAKSAIIKEYAHKMQDNQGEAPATIPPEVDTAIMVALNAMYEPIGMSQSQWDKKAMGTLDNFKADVDKIVARVKELRTKSKDDDPSKLTGKAKRGLRTIFQKKPLLADLDRILKAIDKRTGSFTEDGASEEIKQKWNALREEVVQAKRSGVM